MKSTPEGGLISFCMQQTNVDRGLPWGALQVREGVPGAERAGASVVKGVHIFNLFKVIIQLIWYK